MKTIECSYMYPYFFSKILKTHTKCISSPQQNIMLSTSRSETPHFVETSFPKGLQLTLILCILPLLPCQPFEFCFRDQIWDLPTPTSHSFSSTNLTVLITFTPLHVLVASNGLGIQFFGTRGKQNTKAQQLGKLNYQVSSLIYNRES